MKTTLTFKVELVIDVDCEDIKEAKQATKDIGKYLSEHLKKDLPEKWSGLAEVKSVVSSKYKAHIWKHSLSTT